MTADGKLITGAGKAYDSGRGLFVCVSVFFSFYESDSFIFYFWTIFLLFFIFLFIFALTFHKCQIVMKAMDHFLLFFIFLFIFALTFHKCQIVKKAIL